MAIRRDPEELRFRMSGACSGLKRSTPSSLDFLSANLVFDFFSCSESGDPQ